MIRYADEDPTGPGLIRAEDEGSGKAVLVWQALRPDNSGSQRLDSRLAVLQDIRVSTFLTPLAVEDDETGIRLVMEASSGETLSHVAQRGGLRIGLFLAFAVQMAETVQALHNRRIPHGNLTPDAIFVRPNAQSLKLALHPDCLTQPPNRPAHIGERGLADLVYAAPEQTGRTEGKPDPRSDLYALGVIFHHILAGTPPFRALDRMELVHQILAVPPRPLAEARPDLPDQVAAVVHKLLEKSPDARYQSAFGLLSDLRICADAYEADGTVPAFKLGARDAEAIFRIPDKLYGRDAELRNLADAAEKVATGGVEFVLLPGRSGTGKSAFAARLHDIGPDDRQVTFLSGKYEESQRLPYQAIRDALRQFNASKIESGGAELDTYRDRLTRRLGDNLGIIAEFLPELRQVIGEIAEPEPGDPMERNQRFRIAVQTFFETMCDPDQPIVLFLDDLQWAEGASIALLEDVFRTAQLSHLMVVGAYRDNEAGAGDRVGRLTDAFMDAGVSSRTISIRPLTQQDALAMIVDTMNISDPESLRELARVVHTKTQGNAFHLRRMLTSLYQEGAIRFDMDSGKWRWEMDAITRHVVETDVALLMTERIVLLSPPALETLRYAACFGTTFAPDSLRMLSARETGEIEALLEEAETEGFVERDMSGRDLFSFSHDMVREAAYRLTPPDELAGLHYRIGEFLLRDIEDPASDERLFAALDHMMLGIGLLRDPPVGRLLVRSALAAATRAKAVAAYDTALRYLDAANGIPVSRGGVDWESEPETTARLRLETMEATFLVAGFEAAEPTFRELLANLSSPREKAHVYQVLVTLYTFRSEYDRALEFGIKGLKLLGINLAPPIRPKIGQQLALTHLDLRRHDVFDFSTLPAMDNALSEQRMEMLMICSTPAFLNDKDLFVLISLRMFRTTLQDGLTSVGILSIMNYAIVMYIGFGAVERAYRIASNLFPLIEQRKISSLVRGRLYYTYCIVLAWHFRTYGDLHRLLTEGIKNSWTAADLEYVGYFYYGLLKYTWLGCKPLRRLEAELEEFDRYQKRLNHQVLNDITGIYRRAVERLTGEGPAVAWSETDRALGQTMVGEASVGSFLTAEMLLTHIFRDWRALRDLYEGLLAEEEFTRLGPEFVDYHLLSGLSLTRAPDGVLRLPDRTRRKRLRRHLKALKRLEESYPVNHGFQHRLLLGEINRRNGDLDDALACFTDAVSGAESAGIWSYAGIGSECAAEVAQALEDTAQRDEWLRRARDAYAAWGATGKVGAMLDDWPQLAADPGKPAHASPTGGLDLASIVKTSQAILEITDIDTLLKRLLAIAMENAGANLGQLYLSRDNGFVLAAEADTRRGDVHVSLNDPHVALETLDPKRYPTRVVSDVGDSRSALIVADAHAAPHLARDPYVQAAQPKSLFDMPILGSGSLQGVLHLENTLSPGVFTPARQEIISTIMSLAAISLTNALLYARQEEALETERRAAQELARINDLKDEFLANTSHELRTPLNGIIGLADSMIGGATGQLGEQARHTLHLIVSSGRRLSALVGDILDFSRLKEGEIEISSAPLDIHAVVDVVFTLLGPKARSGGVTLVNAVPQDAPAVLADEDRLQQIFFNLLENAVKFAPGGTVTVDLDMVDGRAQLRVTDDGPGIEAEQKAKIFTAFEQVDASVQREQGGLGLGLAITRRLVELHGGHIEETGAPGQGACFTFDLDVTDERPDARPAGLSAPAAHPVESQSDVVPQVPAPSLGDEVIVRPNVTRPGARQSRALLVDDDPVNLQVLENYMSLEDFQVETALDGESALRLVSDGYDPDIVLLDVMMPRMSGYEVCTRLRETHPAARLPIVMLTAQNRLEGLRAGFQAGATDYLTKPFSRDELSARMHAHLALTRVSKSYERFVPVEFLDFLSRDSILDVDLGDNISRRMTVMFTDIRGFTTIAENAPPSESFQFLNDYFRRMGPIIQENGGVVAQFLGDGMMALFPGSPRDAVTAAVGIQRELRRLNVDRASRNLAPIETGIGLHAGDLIVGILGDKYRLNENVVSSSVNAAARLETLTAQCGIAIAASGEVVEALSPDMQAECRHLTRVRMVGMSQPFDVYEIFAGDIARDKQMKHDSRSDLETAVSRFRKARFAEARAAFEAIAEANPRDRAAVWLATRARDLDVNGSAENWSGFDTLTEK